MPAGWADYTYPITIDAVSVGVLPFDIRITEVTAGVTFNVHVESAETFTVNIQTSAGANIVIDKLTTEAYKEDRRTLSNNGTTPSIMAPGKEYYFGKFFPRGCRGYINTIEIYCGNSDTTDHTLYIYISPQPGMGRVVSTSLTVSAGASNSWRSISIQRFWNYDSMFIYIIGDSSSYPTVGYDTGTPYDQSYSSDEVTWTPQTRRLWVRVNMTGETVGDLPISGTINTVGLPAVASSSVSGVTGIDPGATATLITISGAGRILRVSLYSNTDVVEFRFYVDGVQIDREALTAAGYFQGNYLSAHGYTECTPSVQLLSYTSGGITRIAVTIPFEFKRQFEVRAVNHDTVERFAAAGVVYTKIT